MVLCVKPTSDCSSVPFSFSAVSILLPFDSPRKFAEPNCNSLLMRISTLLHFNEPIARVAADARGLLRPQCAASIARGVSFNISNSIACPTEHGMTGDSIVRASAIQLYLTGPILRRLELSPLSLIRSPFLPLLFSSSVTDIM